MPSIPNFSQSQSGYYIVRGVILICLLIFILVGLTYWGEANNFDLRFSAEFFTEEKEWFLAETPPWNWFYEYGVIPGILVSILSFFTWIYSRTNKKLAILRPYFLICALTPIIASALLVNVVLKDHTGRPRPREIKQFSGNWEYLPALQTGIPGRGHSFPCGHCSIAFTLTSGVVFWRRSRKFAISSLSLGLVFGIMMSIARIAQGGHFITDAMWSLGVVWLTLTALYYFVYQPPRTENKPVMQFTKKQKLNVSVGIILFLSALVIFIWMRRPFYKEHNTVFEINKDVSELVFFVPEKWELETAKFQESENGEFLLLVKGFAPPYTTHYLNHSIEKIENLIKVHFKESIDGYHKNFLYKFKLRIRHHLKGQIKFNDYLNN